jgi:hypothetical protein
MKVELEVKKLDNQGLKNQTVYYAIIKGNGKEKTMSIGKGTYDDLSSMGETQPELPLDNKLEEHTPYALKSEKNGSKK